MERCASTAYNNQNRTVGQFSSNASVRSRSSAIPDALSVILVIMTNSNLQLLRADAQFPDAPYHLPMPAVYE
jgi:hypothetical protein